MAHVNFYLLCKGKVINSMFTSMYRNPSKAVDEEIHQLRKLCQMDKEEDKLRKYVHKIND